MAVLSNAEEIKTILWDTVSGIDNENMSVLSMLNELSSKVSKISDYDKDLSSLNERIEDISELSEHFNNRICEDYRMSKKEITPDAIKELQKIEWTGNIREFRNVLERLIILCDKKITGKDVVAFAAPISR